MTQGIDLNASAKHINIILIICDFRIDIFMNIAYNESGAKEALAYANICRAIENPERRDEDVTGENR